MPEAMPDHDLLFNYLVRLDRHLKRSEIPDEARFFTLLDPDEGPQPVTYPINPFWQHRIRSLLDARAAGKEVSPDGLPPTARAAYLKAAEAIDICGQDVFDGILEDPVYSAYLADCLGYHVVVTLPETEQYARLRQYLHGIPESIRNMKISEAIKYYDPFGDYDFHYLDGFMDMSLYSFFSSYVNDSLARDPRLKGITVRSIGRFLKWAGTSGMEQVIRETFTRRMGEPVGFLDTEIEEIHKVVRLRAAGLTGKEAGARLGITNMKVAADERNIDWCLWQHINGEDARCIHDLVAVYFLMNPGAKNLDKKTLDGLLGPERAFVYWNYIQRNYKELKNNLYSYSPDKDVIHLKRTRKKPAAVLPGTDS